MKENDFFYYEDQLGGIKLPMPNVKGQFQLENISTCLLYTSPSPRDRTRSRMPSSA